LADSPAPDAIYERLDCGFFVRHFCYRSCYRNEPKLAKKGRGIKVILGSVCPEIVGLFGWFCVPFSRHSECMNYGAVSGCS
jgi:hypothetical protein